MDNFPEVKQVISKIGTAEVPTDPMAIEDADIMIVLKDKKEWVSAKNREELIEKMKDRLGVITAAQFEFTQPIQLRFNELMTGVKTDIAVKIYGEDLDELFAQANKAAGMISKLEGAADVKVEQITGDSTVVTAQSEKSLRIVFEAEFLKKTYLELYLDGMKKTRGIIPAGRKERWEAREYIQMKIGNAGGLKARINGKEYTFGLPGQVANKIITWKKDVQNPNVYHIDVKDW